MSNHEIYRRILARFNTVSADLKRSGMHLQRGILHTRDGRQLVLPDDLLEQMNLYVFARKGKRRDLTAAIRRWGYMQRRTAA